MWNSIVNLSKSVGETLFGSNKPPEINPNDQASIKAFQDWAVKNGHMTQAQVDTGYGIYGPKTKAAYAKAMGSTNPAKKSESRQLPSFEQYMYNTGAMGGKVGTGSTILGRLDNAIDLGGTFLGSFLGIDTEMDEGAKRQALVHINNKRKPKDAAIHYDTDTIYGNAGNIGDDLKNGDVGVSDYINAVARYSLGQNNWTKKEGNGGAYKHSDGSYTINDPTDYHMITAIGEDGKPYNVPTEGMTREQIRNVSGNILTDIWNKATGKLGWAATLENIGTRLGVPGSNRSGHISAEDIQNYKKEYEAFLNDPESQKQYWEQVDRYGLKG